MNLNFWIGCSMYKTPGSPVTFFLNCKEINYCITIKCFPILKKIAFLKVFRKTNMQSAKAREIAKKEKDIPY